MLGGEGLVYVHCWKGRWVRKQHPPSPGGAVICLSAAGCYAMWHVYRSGLLPLPYVTHLTLLLLLLVPAAVGAAEAAAHLPSAGHGAAPTRGRSAGSLLPGTGALSLGAKRHWSAPAKQCFAWAPGVQSTLLFTAPGRVSRHHGLSCTWHGSVVETIIASTGIVNDGSARVGA
jgi:hypothetical protein